MKIKDKITGVVNDLSQERFAPYHKKGKSELFSLRGYRHNIILAQTVWEATAIFEVILRNRIVTNWNNWFNAHGSISDTDIWPIEIKSLHHKVRQRYSLSSFNQEALTRLEKQEKYAYQKARIEIKNRNIINGDVIARLTFGFWHECLSRRFRFINRSQVKDILPYYPYKHVEIVNDLADISRDLQSIKDFRNRLAHHEKLNLEKVKKKYTQIWQLYLLYKS